MPRTRSGRRCDSGSVSGSASAASSSSAPASTTSTANTQCQDACSSTAAPSDGRDHRRDAEHQHQPGQHGRGGRLGEQVTDDGDRHHHGCGRADALQDAGHAEHDEVRREHAQHRRHHVQHDAGHQRPPPAQRVRQRADDQLAQRQPGQRPGQGQLDDRRRHRSSSAILGSAGRYMSMVSGPSATMTPSTTIIRVRLGTEAHVPGALRADVHRGRCCHAIG